MSLRGQVNQPEKYLASRLDDLIRIAEIGRRVSTRFLTPAEQLSSLFYVKKRSPSLSFCFDGGYRGAERRTLVLLGDDPYLFFDGFDEQDEKDEQSDNGGFGDDGGWANKNNVGEVKGEGGRPSERGVFLNESQLRAVMGESLLSIGAEGVGENADLCALKIKGSGYRSLDHRAFMGSLLSLGISREMIGDILVKDNRDAVVFASKTAADFVMSLGQIRIGGDTADLLAYEPSDSFDSGRIYREIHIFSSSDRIDSVASELSGMSRETMKGCIRRGEVLCNYFPVNAPDERVSTGDVVTVRGSGKYIIGEFGSLTRHGRMRITAYKYC